MKKQRKGKIIWNKLDYSGRKIIKKLRDQGQRKNENKMKSEVSSVVRIVAFKATYVGSIPTAPVY